MICIYDEIGLLRWSCTCLTGEPQQYALSPYDAKCLWECHADSAPSTHHNPTSPHMLSIQLPLFPFGKVKATCDPCSYEMPSMSFEDWTKGLVLANFGKHV